METENQENSENTIPAQPIDELIKGAEQKMLAESEAPMKRKRGRPRKPTPPEAAPESAVDSNAPLAPATDYAPMIRDLAAMGSGMLQERLGTPAAALTQEEQERLAIGLNPLLQKWFPDMNDALSPELTAVICCGSVAYAVWARVQEDRRAQAAKAAAAIPAAPQADKPGLYPWAPQA